MQDMYKEQSKLERRMAWLIKECDRLSDSIVKYLDDPQQMQIISAYLSNYKSEIDELEKKLAGISKVISQAEGEMEYMKRTGNSYGCLSHIHIICCLRMTTEHTRETGCTFLLLLLLHFQDVWLTRINHIWSRHFTRCIRGEILL